MLTNKYNYINNSNVNSNIDQGLRSYMIKVYKYMALGLLTSCIAATLGSELKFVREMMFNIVFKYGGVLQYRYTTLGTIISLSPIAIALYLSYTNLSCSLKTAKILFFAYSTAMGLSMSSLCFVYTSSSITTTFLTCAILFGTMSIYGYTTKKDLMSFGGFLFMGFIGIFIAILINMFVKSSKLDFIISGVGVIVFTGLIAYDTQKIKLSYYGVLNHNNHENFAIFSALSMYTNVVNLFLFLIRFTGIIKDRRD